MSWLSNQLSKFSPMKFLSPKPPEVTPAKAQVEETKIPFEKVGKKENIKTKNLSKQSTDISANGEESYHSKLNNKNIELE